jgi:sugar phosphate isomerase/epimerase
MLIALHSWSFRDRYKNDPTFNAFKMLDETAKMGFAAIELMTGKAGSPPAPDVGGEDPGGLTKVIRYAEKCGIRVTCLAPYCDFAFVKNEEWRLANIAYIKEWLQRAGDVGVENIRMLTGYYAEGEDPKKLEHLTEAGIVECIPYAEKANVNMAIENHNSIFMKGTEIVELIAKLKSKRLTICPDPSNGFKTFFEPDCSGEVIEDAYRNLATMAPLATNSHLKIHGLDANGALQRWDLDRLVGIYHKAGYRGGISFESIVKNGDLLEPLPRARQLVQAAIDRVCQPELSRA